MTLIQYKALLDRAPTPEARQARKCFMYAAAYSAPLKLLAEQFRKVNSIERPKS